MLSVPQVSVNTSPSNTLGGTWAGAFHPRVGRGWEAGRDAKPRVTTETGEGVRGWCIGRKVPLGEPPPPVTATQTLSASPLRNHRSCGSGEDALILLHTWLLKIRWSQLYSEADVHTSHRQKETDILRTWARLLGLLQHRTSN